MRVLPRALTLVTVVGLVGTASATAARTIVPFGTYKGKALKGASFVVAPSGSSARYHGRADVELLCGSKTQPAPSGTGIVGQSHAVIVLDPSSAPRLKIDNSNGTFTGTRRHDGATVTITGSFSGDASKMVFTVKTNHKCSSSKYTFHSAGGSRS